ncbi:hypothetical protein [Deinococcus sonorensis]|uniref:Uncharacterized protein n=2 Tax=Deinococcus sonorensis TaxID=309891 RepID=A0AAU7U5P0_9DEIO
MDELTERTGAFERCEAPHHVQHNPGLKEGRALAIERRSAMRARPEPRFTLKRVLVDKPLTCMDARTAAGGAERCALSAPCGPA